MTFAARVASIIGYKALPTTVLACATYLVIYILFLVTDTLPGVPKAGEQGGLNLKEALVDLHHITAYPHPYNSHANDQVHAYILSRLETIALRYPHVRVANDLVSNKTWFSSELGGAHAEYFEGTNILVKVDGTSGSKNGGVLFSAHYDSVSTARGAADDGMGVATLIQLVKLFAVQRQPRTAVFNINNGEEDGLHGAHTFLEHPWSKLTDTFLNLEGAAAGGRPILFRATSQTAMKPLANKDLVPHPHANVLSSDAFSRGLIKSGTDFSVYSGQGGMAGLDLAFYKGRSMYHTKYDGMQYTVGGEKSLWSMMEAARGIGIGLLRAHASRAEGSDDAVYFDVFKSAIIIFRQKSLLIFNIILLIMGPLFLIMLIFCETIVLEAAKWNNFFPIQFHNGRPSSPSSRTRSANSVAESDDAEDDEHHAPATEEYSRPSYMIALDFSRVYAIWRHAKFWVAFGIVIALQIVLVRWYTKVNPFAIYSSPYIILLSCGSLAYLTLIHLLTFPSSLPFFDLSGFNVQSSLLPHPQQEKQTIFFHLYAFTWFLLVLSTVGITRVQPGIGGGYLFSVWNALVAVACVFVGIEGLLTPTEAQKIPEEMPVEELSGDEGEEDGDGIPRGSHRNVEDANEITPLIWREGREGTARSTRRSPSPVEEGDNEGQDEPEGSAARTLASWWWIVQFVISVPIPVILFGQVTMLLLDAVPQTLADGGAAWLVYALTSVPAALLVLPLAPFAAKLQPCYRLSRFVFALFLVSTIYALWTFPFSINAPLKIFFRQTVSFPGQHAEHSHAIPQLPVIITELTGAKGYLPTLLIPSLPSAQGKKLSCREEKFRPSLITCGWETKLMPSPGAYSSSTNKWETGQFFQAQAQSTGATSGRVRVKAKNSRVCRLYFDTPVEKYNVRRIDNASLRARKPSGASPAQKLFRSAAAPSVRELRLSTRTWEQELAVDLSWAPAVNSTNGKTSLRGRVTCQWAEYESGMVDTGVGLISNATAFQPKLSIANGAKIPAFEEALAYLPSWAVLTKLTDGLVEVSAPFVI